VESEIKIEGVQYLAYKKNMKKAIVKALRNLKAMKIEFTVSTCTNKDNETLKEAEAVTVNSLASWLIFITASKGLLMQRKWSEKSQSSCSLKEYSMILKV
jgi:phage I-like protein